MPSRGRALPLAVILVAMITIGGVVGGTLVTGSPSETPAEATDQSAGDAPADLNVSVMFEQQGEQILVVVSGPDVANVSAFTVENATLKTQLDPSMEQPRAVGSVSPPTTVRVIATLPDGETQAVGTQNITAAEE